MIDVEVKTDVTKIDLKISPPTDAATILVDVSSNPIDLSVSVDGSATEVFVASQTTSLDLAVAPVVEDSVEVKIELLSPSIDLIVSPGSSPGPPGPPGPPIVTGKNPVFTYSNGELVRVDYDQGLYKQLTYSGSALSQLEYYNGTVTTQKTFNYSSGILTSIDEIQLP